MTAGAGRLALSSRASSFIHLMALGGGGMRNSDVCVWGVLLNDPAGRDELSVDLLAGEGFGRKRHAGRGGKVVSSG